MSSAEMTILLLEDNLGDARLLQESLAEIADVTFALTHAQTFAEALEALATFRFDLGLLDLRLPDALGLEIVRGIHRRAPEMPLVVLSGVKDERLAVRALQEGAQDYLVKAELRGPSLWRALRYAMERQQVQYELRNLSLVDDLTGLSNRKGFLNLAQHHVSLAYRTGTPFLVGFIDLDNMKHINDKFGHQEGNRALVETANILRDSFRQSDILARFGGDEFAILVTEAFEDSIAIVSQRVQDKVRLRNARREQLYELSMSIGIAISDPAKPADLEQLLQQADRLMYGHKQQKRAATPLTPAGGAS